MEQYDTDIELVNRIKQGDKTAFDVLVLKYQHRIAVLVSRYMYDPAEIHDVTQEVFIKAYKAIHLFRSESAFYTWLYRIAINTVKNHIASVARKPVDVEYDEMNISDKHYHQFNLRDTSTPENFLLRDEIEIVVFEAVEGLPEDLRTALLLRELDGLTYEKIADVMECPVGTVRSRIYRAREAIEVRVKPLLERE